MGWPLLECAGPEQYQRSSSGDSLVDSSQKMGLEGEDSAVKRLDRARAHYENLLMHAGNALLEDDHQPRSSPSVARNLAIDDFKSSVVIPPPAPELSFRPVSGSKSVSKPSNMDGSFSWDRTNRSMDHSSSALNVTYKSPSKSILPVLHEHLTGPVIGNEEKSNIIVSLQEENDRLRQKLHLALEAAEQIVRDAQESNNDIVSEYEHKMFQLQSKNLLLEEENATLRALADRSREKLAEEHQSTEKTVKALERFRKRSHEYLETQRKIHHILRDPAGLHYTSVLPTNTADPHISTMNITTSLTASRETKEQDDQHLYRRDRPRRANLSLERGEPSQTAKGTSGVERGERNKRVL